MKTASLTRRSLFCLGITLLGASAWATPPVWSGYAGNAQHTANSTVGSQPLDSIVWQTAVDEKPQYSGTSLLIHYGSPMVTAANTVLVPVKTGASDGFRVDARSGDNGSLLWSMTTDYSLPTAGWTPSYSPTVTPAGRIYMPGAGGTLYYRDNIDGASPTAPTQVAFYGINNYNANPGGFAGIKVCTPLTSDSQGNVYFGYRTESENSLGVTSGLARIGADGSTSFVTANTATAGGASRVVMNCAPAISNDGSTVYVAMSDTNSAGYLVAMNATTLATTSKIALKDPKIPANPSILQELGTASPMVAPDGRVFLGVFENPGATSKGWMLQMDAGLTTTFTPGSFGWDDTATVVPASAVPSYHGSSSYLIMTKYNNYASTGGDGVNKLAILDPNDTQVDPRNGATVMKEVLTIAGVTPDSEFPGVPGAVREWCINTAAFDPSTSSILANSEDGRLYRWDLTTNTFTQSITLTAGIGEAYTPTLIGADGKVYAINNATLFAVGRASGAPEPGALCLFAIGGGALWRKRRKH